ncbi:hypothetical protein OOJ09_04680 [Mesorhizobium qingshengii]|uniref:Uncharacterized protein n=1 Tax=Mesorhizobium qingshengii TaxID=1165689 RepID=A0ABT4QPG3_9HYPH|nr:hypothetical protein [Mesorhizobium qingshengii]MCZ8543461.1 hypothetical protein [Mesorhizobium qingshengii]
MAWLKPFHSRFCAKGKGRRVVAVPLVFEQFQEKCEAVFPGKAHSAFPWELRQDQNESECLADAGVDRVAVAAGNDQEEQDRGPRKRFLGGRKDACFIDAPAGKFKRRKPRRGGVFRVTLMSKPGSNEAA